MEIKRRNSNFMIFGFHLYFCLVFENIQVTLKEFKHTLKIVHDVCQTVTKIPEENIQQVRNGNYIEDEMTKVSE